ncbi:hypothetical protein D3C72_2389280 [compost metagenome]|jgi:hypothetical protein
MAMVPGGAALRFTGRRFGDFAVAARPVADAFVVLVLRPGFSRDHRIVAVCVATFDL